METPGDFVIAMAQELTGGAAHHFRLYLAFGLQGGAARPKT
jgi:hypothetical protein